MGCRVRLVRRIAGEYQGASDHSGGPDTLDGCFLDPGMVVDAYNLANRILDRPKPKIPFSTF